MNKTWTVQRIYELFLTFVSSCTLADLNNEELENEINKFLGRALADFRFPQVSLDIEKEIVDGATTYVFTDKDFGQREVNVLLAYMKKYFFEWMLAREKNFEQQYYDSDTRTHSQANMVQQLRKTYETAAKEANDANYDYSRSNKDRKPLMGSVNRDD